MIDIIRTNSDNPDFISLVKLLDAELAERDGADHSFYAQYNKIDKIKYVIVAHENDRAPAVRQHDGAGRVGPGARAPHLPACAPRLPSCHLRIG